MFTVILQVYKLRKTNHTLLVEKGYKIPNFSFCVRHHYLIGYRLIWYETVELETIMNNFWIDSKSWKMGRICGELAQMVERSLSMREVPGSIPGFSKSILFQLGLCFFFFPKPKNILFMMFSVSFFYYFCLNLAIHPSDQIQPSSVQLYTRRAVVSFWRKNVHNTG